jgi:preprotein translocase subunit SecA
LKGLDAGVNALFGLYHRRSHVLARFKANAEKIDALAPQFAHLSDHLLQERLREYRDSFRRAGRCQAERLLPALAAIREASDRKLGLRPFPVQLMGALALHHLVETGHISIKRRTKCGAKTQNLAFFKTSPV